MFWGIFFRATILVGSDEMRAAELRDYNLLSGMNIIIVFFFYCLKFFDS